MRGWDSQKPFKSNSDQTILNSTHANSSKPLPNPIREKKKLPNMSKRGISLGLSISKATMHPHGLSKEDKNHENQNDERVYKSNIHQDKKRKKQPMNTCGRIEPNSLIQFPISFQWNNCTDMVLKAVSGPDSSIMGT